VIDRPVADRRGRVPAARRHGRMAADPTGEAVIDRPVADRRGRDAPAGRLRRAATIDRPEDGAEEADLAT